MSATIKPEEIPRAISIPEEMHVMLVKTAPYITRNSAESWEETLLSVLTVGLTDIFRMESERLEKKLEIIRRHEEVEAAIVKMTHELPISNEEIDLIWHAAKHGHVRAAILMDDFKRFGRSMNRRKGGAH